MPLFSFFPCIFFVFVCYQSTGPNFLPGNLIFGMRVLLDLIEKYVYFSFQKFSFFRFLESFFYVFPYIFFVFAIDHNIGPTNLIFEYVCSLWHRKSKKKKKKIPKFWKLAFLLSIFRFSYMFFDICLLPGYRSQFFTWELNFSYEGTLGYDKEIFFIIFQKFSFFRFLGSFFVFPYIFFVFAIDHNIYAHCDLKRAKKKFSEILKIDVLGLCYIFPLFSLYLLVSRLQVKFFTYDLNLFFLYLTFLFACTCLQSVNTGISIYINTGIWILHQQLIQNRNERRERNTEKRKQLKKERNHSYRNAEDRRQQQKKSTSRIEQISI